MLLPIPKGPLRHGYTTGATACAATKAALMALLQQKTVNQVTITLPRGEKVSFDVKRCQYTANEATCLIIKDGGDDPDVTHGLEIGSTVTLNESGIVQFLQGKGVGMVTLPGLEIAVGEPAINPVPRKMIQKEISLVMNDYCNEQGVDVKIFVPQGYQIATKTLNSRIGIEQGISILGTTGIVKPYSSESFIAAIHQGIQVATSNGSNQIVINSGGRSERFLKARFPQIPPIAFVQYGNWIGETLTKLNESNVEKVYLGIMLGKAVKLAQGNLDTHSRNVLMDTQFMSQIASSCPYPASLCNKIEQLTLARNLTKLIPFNQEEPYYQKLGVLCHKTCAPLAGNFVLVILLMDLEGNIIEIT